MQAEWLANYHLHQNPHEHICEIVEMEQGTGPLFFDGRLLFDSFLYLVMPCYDSKDLHDHVADMQKHS